MKLDMKSQLVDLSGRGVNIADEGVEVPYTLRRICVDALLAVDPRKNDEVSGEEKLRRYLLATALMQEDEPDLKPEDLTLLKRLIGHMYTPLVVGFSFNLLNG